MRLKEDDKESRRLALNDLFIIFRKALDDDTLPPLDYMDILVEDEIMRFLFISGDYIPRKISHNRALYEYEFLKILQGLYDNRGLIIDVGGNIGNHALFFSKKMHAQVIAIEPEPHNFLCLAANKELNDVTDRINAVNCAVGAKAGALTIEMDDDDNFGSFTAIRNANPNSNPPADSKPVNVPVVRLDDLLDSLSIHDPISIIKMDVEGMELDVLQGGLETIAKSLPVISVECSMETNFLEIEAFLARFGYFVIEMINLTPTFIFLNTRNLAHESILLSYLRSTSLKKLKLQGGWGSRG